MPTDTAIWISGIVVMFIIFGGALIWTDHYSHGYPKKSDK